MPDVCIYWLHYPTFYDPGDVSELEIGLVIEWRWRAGSKVDLILTETAQAVGDARIDDTRAEAIIRPLRNIAIENNPTVDLETDLIAVGRANRGAGENGNAAVPVAALRSNRLPIDNSVNSVITAMHERHAAARGAGQQYAVIGVALISELSEISPAADLQRRRKTGIIFADSV